MSALERIRTVIAEELCIDESEVTPESTFASLGADSLDKVSLALALEHMLALTITDDDLKTLFTVQDLVNYAERQ
jgi:acyl carrier protein